MGHKITKWSTGNIEPQYDIIIILLLLSLRPTRFLTIHSFIHSNEQQIENDDDDEKWRQMYKNVRKITSSSHLKCTFSVGFRSFSLLFLFFHGEKFPIFLNETAGLTKNH